MYILMFWIYACLKLRYILSLTYVMHPEEFRCHGYKFIHLMITVYRYWKKHYTHLSKFYS